MPSEIAENVATRFVVAAYEYDPDKLLLEADKAVSQVKEKVNALLTGKLGVWPWRFTKNAVAYDGVSVYEWAVRNTSLAVELQWDEDADKFLVLLSVYGGNRHQPAKKLRKLHELKDPETFVTPHILELLQDSLRR